MYSGRVRAHRWVLVFLSAGGGLLWGVAALVTGFSWLFTRATGVLRGALTLLVLPLYLAGWAANALQLDVIDPSALVIAMGGVLGVVAFGIVQTLARVANLRSA